jgi:hypothetical protein
MDQYVLNSVFLKFRSDEYNHNNDGPWLVAMGVDYYSSVATSIDDIIMSVATIHL